ncbi:MAG: DeoR/GlpR family DNA-binding transcription regulator [Candidatus Nanopelagicales bacterium]
MLATQRRELILHSIENDGAVTVSRLAISLGVSEMTVRRDLDILEKTGQVIKVHGGATSPRMNKSAEPGFAAKVQLEQVAKNSIAKLATEMVSPGAAVALTAGSTTYAIAKHLINIPNLTVITNSIRVAELFHDGAASDSEIIVLGGTRTPSDALVGPMANHNISNLNIDLCFMGVHGMDAQAGVTSPNLLEAETNRALAEVSRQFVVVADATKWGVIGLHTIAPLSEISTLITDKRISTNALNTLKENIDDIRIAAVSD